MDKTINEILDFWFSEAIEKQWFNASQALDVLIKEKYENLWQQAKQGELDDWQKNGQGCLALIIVLDQFPLNMFRGQKLSFSTEQQAVTITKYAISHQLDAQLSGSQLGFLYLPLMHSEQLADQDLSVELFTKLGSPDSLAFANHHRQLIRRFGRFPHRNAILGRVSSAEEQIYLNSDEAFTG